MSWPFINATKFYTEIEFDWKINYNQFYENIYSNYFDSDDWVKWYL